MYKVLFGLTLLTIYIFFLPPLCSGKGYSSRASGLNQSDLLLSGGSVGQLALGGGGGGVYLPDYSVRQLTDLQVLKVTKTNPQMWNSDGFLWSFVYSRSLIHRISFEKQACHSKTPVFNLGIPEKADFSCAVAFDICPNPRF